jgi:hypothetical protein
MAVNSDVTVSLDGLSINPPTLEVERQLAWVTRVESVSAIPGGERDLPRIGFCLLGKKDR